MAELVDVGAVEEFPEGRTRVRAVDGRELAILRWRGCWYALRNVCPHRGASLCADGGIVGPLLEEVGAGDDLCADATRPALMCPWHRWEFDLSSGFEVRGKDRVKMYPVRVDGERVLVQIGAARPAAAARS